MDISHGWIKLYRCLLEDAVCQKSAYFHLWVTLLLTAAHTDREFIFNDQIHKLKPGQLLTGRKKLSKLTKIPEATIGRMLKCLESGHKIEQKTFKRFRIITIINWSSYQSEQLCDSDSGHTAAPNRPPSDPHVSTYKNDKNEKNEKTLSQREDVSFNDLNDDNDPLLQDTLRKAQEYENAQKRIREMFHPRNSSALAPLDADGG